MIPAAWETTPEGQAAAACAAAAPLIASALLHLSERLGARRALGATETSRHLPEGGR